ncbi:hypothetical protein COHA_001662 [Chlorella ohadii]|uniref:Sulfotransferase n=1 Tax=Chlorella ohadii TaxID=2649997 RepID=A0AAD5DW81_9CHLO|nr:hypothetical protein COHA_001662 [Chlorella ohadii]
MGSPPGRGVGRRRSWPGGPLAAVAEDWHAEQRAEAGRRVRVGNRALALLAAAGILACLIVLSSGSVLGDGKSSGLRRHRLESGRRMAAEVPFAQQHPLAAGVLVGSGQQQQGLAQLMPKLAADSSEDEIEAASHAAAADAALDEEDEEEGEEEEEEETEAGIEGEAVAAGSENAATTASGGGAAGRGRGSGKAGSEAAAQEEKAAEEEDEELLTQEEFELQAKRWQAEAAAAAQHAQHGGEGSQRGKQQTAAEPGTAEAGAASGAAKLAAAGQQKPGRAAAAAAEGAAEDALASEGSKRSAAAGGRKVGMGSKAGAAEPAEPAEDEEGYEAAAKRQQRRREAAARASQASLAAAAATDSDPRAARSEPASGKAAAAVAASKGGEGAAGQREEEQAPVGPKSPYQLALEKCNDLACLREAAKQERHAGQFLFPHALVIGWQESEFFSEGCDSDPTSCPHQDQQEYIQHRALRQGLRKPVIEGSTRYAAAGPRMAKGLHEVFPWLRLVASLREPISRAVAVLASAKDEASQSCLAEGALFGCLKQRLPALNYSAQLSAWLDTFPAEQVLLLQYETLASPDQERVAGQLASLHKFLGLESAAAPADGSLQLREPQPGTRSWRIKTEHYQALVKLVRPDAKSIAEMVGQRGFGDGKQWLKSWEKVWQATLNTCTLEGSCTIRLA